MTVAARQEYTIATTVALPYDEAVQKTRDALKEEGFGILTEIDVKKTMKEKLDVDFRRYVILGACNPPLAHKAFEVELDIGALLPCNVIVYEEGQGCVVAAQDPEKLLSFVGNPALEPVGTEVAAKMRKVIEAVASSGR